MVGVGIVALILRSYLTPDATSPTTMPVTAAATAPIISVPVPLVGAAADQSREDRAGKRAVSRKRGSQDASPEEARRRSAVSPGFRFR